MVIPYLAPLPNGGVRVYGGEPTYGVLRPTKSGLRRFVFMTGGKNYKVSRMICEAFHGPLPFPRAVAMHKNDNPQNNRPRNLKWATQKENLNSPAFLKYCRSRTGRNNPYIKGRKNESTRNKT